MCGGAGEGGQEVAEAAGPWRLPGAGTAGKRGRVEHGAAVGAVGAQQRSGDGQLERAGRIVGDDGAGCCSERVVGVARGPDVDLDAAAEPVDVGAQHRSSASSRAAADRVRAGAVCPADQAVRAAAYRQRGAGLLVGGELGGALVGGRGGGVPAASFGPCSGRGQAGDDVLRRGRRRRRPGATRTGPGLQRDPRRRPAPGAPRGVPCWSRPGTPRTGPAGAVPGRCRRRRRAAPSVPRRPGCRGRRRAPAAAARTVGDVPGVVGGGDQQQGLHVGWQPAAAVQEDPLDAGGEVQLGGHRRGAGELLRGQVRGELDEGERVPRRLGHQPVRDVVGHGVAGHLGEQRAGGVPWSGAPARRPGRRRVRTRGPRRRGRRTRPRPGRRRGAGRRPAPRRRWPGRATGRRR